MQVGGVNLEFDGRVKVDAFHNHHHFVNVFSGKLDEIVGKNVETPEGVLCKIAGWYAWTGQRDFLGRPLSSISLVLEPLERPF